MAIEPTTYGFPGGAIDAAALPEWVKTARARFSVSGPDDWKVSSLGSLDRGIRIEVGTGHGAGVTVTTHEYETMSLPYPDIATRWYLIARRRNWSGSGTATLVALPGGSTPSIPAVGNASSQRSDTPGVESDQPLALVRVTQKDRTVQEIIPLHAWAGPGGVEAAHDLALQYLGEPGAVVRTPNGVSRYQRGANNVWGWVPVDDYRPTLVIEDADATAPKIKTDTVTVRTDANGATAIVFKERFPRALASVSLQQTMAPNLGLIHFQFDESLSGPQRVAFFAFDAAGNRLRNTSGIRVSYTAIGD